LHSELYSFVFFTKYCKDNAIKEDEMGWACGANEIDYRSVQIFVGNLEGRRPFSRSRRRFEDNINLGIESCGLVSSGPG
jgi:hypothetical protein